MSKETTFTSAIWERRWDAVTLTMDHMLATLWDHPAKTRQKTLESVLTALNVFGEHQINFFLNGFAGKSNVLLAPSPDYPPAYVLSATLDQIMHDLNVIGRAWEQRREGLVSPLMQETLYQADQLANKALAPAIDHNLIDPAIAVTYFQKDTNVRIIPYAPVSFIGLPLTCLTTKRDLLATMHEVGHYIYRYGRTPSGDRFKTVLPEQYSGQDDWRAAWMEEIFADVYGALVGGPAMALGFKDLLSASPREHFTHDDGEHPVGALRLGIYQTVFQALKVDDGVLNELKTQRLLLAEANNNPTFFVTAKGQKLKLQAAEAKLTTLVQSLLDNELAGFRPTPPWQGQVTATDVETALDGQFTAYVKENAGQLADLHLADGQIVLQPRPETWAGKPVARKIGATELWPNPAEDVFVGQPTSTMSADEWMARFNNSGWATEETGGNAHKQR